MSRFAFILPLLLLTTTFLGCESEPEPTPEPMTDTAEPAPDASGTAATGATVGITRQEPYGAFLTDGGGMSAYLFLADTQGQGSTCYDACAEAWPPLLTEGAPQAGAPPIQESMLGTTERRDGTRQVTYNGWPLYYYHDDQQPGDVTGQDVEEYGAEWYLVSPQGETVEGEEGEGS